MASMRDIKRRRISIQSTGQITKAMKLVATVKLQRAKVRAQKSKLYFDTLYETIVSILAKLGDVDHPYINRNNSTKKGIVIITSNRGLAGGYNSNVVKLITRGNICKEDILLYTVGRKGRDALLRNGYKVKSDYSSASEYPELKEANIICDEVMSDYINGEIGEIYIAYTMFKNTVVHIPTLKKLLPISSEDLIDNPDVVEDESNDKRALMTFEPKEEEALNYLIPRYIGMSIYGGMIEAVASENGARMQAMDSATNNAEEMIDELTLLYNRARQGSITQELTEIIAGAEAIS